jgi:hypothetical protein
MKCKDERENMGESEYRKEGRKKKDWMEGNGTGRKE